MQMSFDLKSQPTERFRLSQYAVRCFQGPFRWQWFAPEIRLVFAPKQQQQFRETLVVVFELQSLLAKAEAREEVEQEEQDMEVLQQEEGLALVREWEL